MKSTSAAAILFAIGLSAPSLVTAQWHWAGSQIDCDAAGTYCDGTDLIISCPAAGATGTIDSCQDQEGGSPYSEDALCQATTTGSAYCYIPSNKPFLPNTYSSLPTAAPTPTPTPLSRRRAQRPRA